MRGEVCDENAWLFCSKLMLNDSEIEVIFINSHCVKYFCMTSQLVTELSFSHVHFKEHFRNILQAAFVFIHMHDAVIVNLCY